MRKWPLLILLVAICTVIVPGCTDTSTPIAVPLVAVGNRGSVTLKTWVVLRDNEQINFGGIGADNDGCRLSHEEMTKFMDDLVARSSAWGQGVQFAWDRTISIAYFNTTRTYNFEEAVGGPEDLSRLYLRTDGTVQYIPGVLNIYFVGDWRTNHGNLRGLCFDPQRGDADSDSFIDLDFEYVPSVFMTDWDARGGSAALARALTLEHEVTHYLGPFGGRNFCPDGGHDYRRWGEHAGNCINGLPLPTGNILTAGNVVNGMRGPDVIIPGTSYQPARTVQGQSVPEKLGTAELGLVSLRIWEGRWNDSTGY